MDPHDTPPTFSLAVEYRAPGRTRVALRGELDIARLASLRRLLYALVEEGRGVLLDLGALRFVDVPGVRLLVDVAALARRRDCELAVTGAGGDVARVLELTRVRPLLPLTAS
jgi:anti-anti-sigma factor